MTPLGAGAAWIDGAIVPIAEARIPVNDWGLTHSDAVYDVVPVWNGAFLGFDRYLDRFMASLAAGRFDTGLSKAEWRAALHRMVAASGLTSAYVAMVTTRGLPRVPGSRDPRDCVNRPYAWCVPFVHVIPEATAARGVRLHLPANVRRIPEASVDPRAKNYHWGDFTQALFAAHDRGFDTAALLDEAGGVTEGPGFNLFMVKDGTVSTPARGVLEGVTRALVLEMAAAAGLRTEARPIPLAELMEADEVFLSSSGGGPSPVTEIDGRLFGNGAPGPTALALRAAWWRWAESGPEREPVSAAA